MAKNSDLDKDIARIDQLIGSEMGLGGELTKQQENGRLACLRSRAASKVQDRRAAQRVEGASRRDRLRRWRRGAGQHGADELGHPRDRSLVEGRLLGQQRGPVAGAPHFVLDSACTSQRC